MLAKGKNLHSKTNDFKRLCKESEEKFRQQERSKRCRKEGEPNDADSQLPTVRKRAVHGYLSMNSLLMNHTW